MGFTGIFTDLWIGTIRYIVVGKGCADGGLRTGVGLRVWSRGMELGDEARRHRQQDVSPL